MIDHVTIHLSPNALRRGRHKDGLAEFCEIIGYPREVEPDDPFEHGYEVRWFRPEHGDEPPTLHFVAYEGLNADLLGLGHFCVVVGPESFSFAAESPYCCRNSGSGRIWLRYGSARVEVRSS